MEKPYPTLGHFIEHLGDILRREAEALVAAGIDIVQLDDPALTYFCDEKLMKGETHDERLRRDWNPAKELPMAISAINRITDGLTAEVHLHCCHSVYERRSDVCGNYRPLLPKGSDLTCRCAHGKPNQFWAACWRESRLSCPSIIGI